MNDPIVLATYDDAWPKMFAYEAALLWEALPDNAVMAIEHIGSTAVPGLTAKPIVDIVLGIRATYLAPDPDSLKRLGYERGHPDDHSPDWIYYVKRNEAGERIAHLHVIVHEGAYWNKWIRFRDKLRVEASLAREYAKLKRDLARQYRNDRVGYTFGKDRFVAQAIGPWGADMADVVLRPATTSDRAFVERIYFDTQRWIIEKLFGWRGDDFERAKFDQTYARESTSKRLIGDAASASLTMTLSTAKINPARNLYERLGFRVVSESEFKVFLERLTDAK